MLCLPEIQKIASTVSQFYCEMNNKMLLQYDRGFAVFHLENPFQAALRCRGLLDRCWEGANYKNEHTCTLMGGT